ncbi:hypothetical protein NHX12_027572, partial [Muraenolepis orangiensis]
MELRKRINTAGVLNWTPTPLRTSPPSSAVSEDGWEDEGGGVDDEDDEDDCEELRAEDFERHMDENGIIGLGEALEDVELGEEGDEGGGAWCVPTRGRDVPVFLSAQHGEHTPTAAVGKPSGRNGEHQKCQQNISPFSSSPGLDPVSPPSPSVPSSPSPPRSYTYPHLLHFSSEELAHSVGIEAETLPDGDGFSASLPESCCSSRSRVGQASEPHWVPDLKVRPDPVEEPTRPPRRKRTKDTSQTSRTDRPEWRYSSGTSSSRPSNLPERPSRTTCSMKDQAVPPEHLHASRVSPGGRISRTSRERSNKTPQRFAKDEPELRTEPPSFRTPDFSLVEPKVHFPKSGYEPPKSQSSGRVRLSPETTLVFKSPADIAKEVLFSSTDVPPSPPPSPPGPEQNITISIVPQDFRCPQHATRLVEQLQEEYNRLLTRFAEAENTIDRLRLKAKVNLYSDPKRPDQSLRSRMMREGSKVMTLSLPQAQRPVMGSHSEYQSRQEETQPPPGGAVAPPGGAVAPPGGAVAPPGELGSTRESCGSTRGSCGSTRGSCGSTKSPTRTLTKQAHKFLQQVKRFEDLMASGKLEPSERLKGLSRLVQGLDLLERGYLAARDDRTPPQRRVGEVGTFDPNRELEGLIFQCGTCVEELREVSGQEQGSPPPPAPRARSLSLLSEPTEPLSHPQSPVVLLPRETETPQAGPTRPQLFDGPLPEFPGAPHPDWGPDQRGAVLSKGPQTAFRPRGDPTCWIPEPRSHSDQVSPEDKPWPKVHLILPEQSTSDDEDDDDRATPTKQRTGQSARPSLKAADQSQGRSVPGQARRPSSQRPPGLQSRGGKPSRNPSSSLTSLGESEEGETKSSRLGGGPRRGMSQDGVVSPETDSGFLGSDATQAAVTSPLHQRGPESDWWGRRWGAGPVVWVWTLSAPTVCQTTVTKTTVMKVSKLRVPLTPGVAPPPPTSLIAMTTPVTHRATAVGRWITHPQTPPSSPPAQHLRPLPQVSVHPEPPPSPPPSPPDPQTPPSSPPAQHLRPLPQVSVHPEPPPLMRLLLTNVDQEEGVVGSHTEGAAGRRTVPPGGPWTLTPDPQPQPGRSLSGERSAPPQQHWARQHGRSAWLGSEARVGRQVCAMCGLSEPAGPGEPHTVPSRDPECVPRGPQPAAGLEAGLGGLRAPASSLLGSLGLWLPACHPALL